MNRINILLHLITGTILVFGAVWGGVVFILCLAKDRPMDYVWMRLVAIGFLCSIGNMAAMLYRTFKK